MNDDSDFFDYGKEWSLTESDPGVFYELVEELGCTGVDFQEVLDIEEGSLKKIENSKKIYGYIFLFKYNKDETRMVEAIEDSQMVDDLPPKFIFPKQVVNNACATIAVLAVILNRNDINLGAKLESVKSVCMDTSSLVQGMAIAQNDFILNAHNHFKANSSFEFIPTKNNGKKPAFHFISYIPFEGKVYELDGLKEQPICLGQFDEGYWSQLVEKRIKSRIDNLQTDSGKISEIRFNLMAVTENTLPKLQKAILDEKCTISRIAFKLLSLGEDVEDLIQELFDSDNPDELDNYDSDLGIPYDDLSCDLTLLKDLLESHRLKLKNLLSEEKSFNEEKMNWKKENIYRRHDFVPFILCALRHLAKKKELRKAYFNAIKSSYTKGSQGQN